MVTWRKGEKALASKTSILSHSAGEVRLLCQGKADRVSQMPGVIPQKEKKYIYFFFFFIQRVSATLATTRTQNPTAVNPGPPPP